MVRGSPPAIASAPARGNGIDERGLRWTGEGWRIGVDREGHMAAGAAFASREGVLHGFGIGSRAAGAEQGCGGWQFGVLRLK
jgi:hypothetical protein